jgi:CelD/BcsL family acetyltransferase involved in cellulose biosynthesis
MPLDSIEKLTQPTGEIKTVVANPNGHWPSNLARDWAQLSGGVPFRTPLWNSAWWRHYGRATDRLCLWTVADHQGTIHSLVPWYLRQMPWGQRVIRFLGTGEVCSEHLTILADADIQREVVMALARRLSEDEAGSWDTLELNGIDAENEPVHDLVRILASMGHMVHSRPTLRAWRAELPESWDDFLRTMSRNRRERIRRSLRQTVDVGGAEVHSAVDLPSLERGWAILESLHAKRWQKAGQRGCFVSQRYAAFHREMAPRLLVAGKLRLRWIEIDGCPIAVEYGVCDDQTVYFYQSGFDPDAAHLSPGWLCVALSIKHAIEAGYRRFDFLRGDEAYKASLGARPRMLHDIRVFARHRRGQSFGHAWNLLCRTKSVVKRLQGRACAAADDAE